MEIRKTETTHHPPNWPQMAVISLFTGIIYFLSNWKENHYYDYTFRVAGNFLDGKIAFVEQPPSWLNEFVPFEGFYYSVFPLGSVLSMLPFALLKKVGLIEDMPSSLIGALLISGICLFMMLIARRYRLAFGKLIAIVAAFLFGTWVWANTVHGGAWQLALVFAMLGSIGAIYFTVYDRKPFWAGFFFAMGFGNRTEVLLTAPILMYLLTKEPYIVPEKQEEPEFAEDIEEVQVTAGQAERTEVSVEHLEPAEAFHELTKEPIIENTRQISLIRRVIDSRFQLAWFCMVPFVLGISTLAYNYVRFHSFTDFGYSRIPGVLDEPWYRYGIFSIWYIPNQIYEMLFKLWEVKETFPYYIPNGFSASILISSPFILLAFRFGAKNFSLKRLSWLAILILCFILWMHGNAGGWQFGYRYATVCLPWLYIIMLENSDEELSLLEAVLFLASICVSSYGMWIFNWTEYMQP